LIYRLRVDYLLNLIRATGDFAVCLNENNIPRMMFGIEFNPGVEGVCGIISAGVYIYGLIQL
jgi:hypothetical protein